MRFPEQIGGWSEAFAALVMDSLRAGAFKYIVFLVCRKAVTLRCANRESAFPNETCPCSGRSARSGNRAWRLYRRTCVCIILTAILCLGNMHNVGHGILVNLYIDK